MQKAMATLQATPEEQAVAEGKKVFGFKKMTKKKGEGSDLYKIVKLVMDRNLDPAIVFSFAKKWDYTIIPLYHYHYHWLV